MITHASVAKSLSDNLRHPTYNREDLDLMKAVERSINQAIRIRAKSSNLSLEGTSERTTTKVRSLLRQLGYTTKVEDLGGKRYLFLYWDGRVESLPPDSKNLGGASGGTTQGDRPAAGGDNPPAGAGQPVPTDNSKSSAGPA